MSFDKHVVDAIPQDIESTPSPSARSRLWRWLSTGLIVVGLLLLGGGGVMAYLNSAAVLEPPAPVGLVEPASIANLEDNPRPAVADTLPISATQPLSPPSMEENPLPVVAEGESSAEAVDVATSASTLGLASSVSSAGPGLGAARVVSQAEGDMPSSAPTLAANSVPPATNPPTRIVAPAINLDAEVVPVGWKQVLEGGKLVSVWEVAEYAAGWHKNSALPGGGGNVVLSGHHNTKGEVFRYIIDLEPGDVITLYADERPYTYSVESRLVVRDKGMSEEKRRENARWIGSFPDDRLTLVTCWPYTGNTHRVIVVAKPTE